MTDDGEWCLSELDHMARDARQDAKKRDDGKRPFIHLNEDLIGRIRFGLLKDEEFMRVLERDYPGVAEVVRKPEWSGRGYLVRL